ncbi:aminotransferase class I/II-fold pyridoxal phosphate-dependent enzyme [Roseitranquillus sediminis]|uniref:aminotransferase class I/II-fold pyridoxal phosphate-dependent enzyme n=1 Tax=Roseitranquillus sediminis TaxID=2809051 RepID=UPI001D0C6CFE|nr:aminotransferase class I/II-fold pyridoxal phosphate-dependent enzyme [Roseitranquillus sediminis]MBM9593709.1 aminotransferase class I/II-fold pyridoxal phosphate-dependent enzyme [Roseitranquillus sediminis]
MNLPDRFSDLPEYAFPRLRGLLDVHAPGGEPIHMTIGEPRHPFPSWLVEVIANNAEGFGRYPPNEGTDELRRAITGWFRRRYGVTLDPDTQVTVLNGTREGLFNACLALCPGGADVLVPNPFYQVYAVGALAVGARPVYLPALPENGFLPDFDAVRPEVLDRTAIAWLCSPSNPQGAVADESYWRHLIELAERHDFRVFADECYSEIWRKSPPPGALEVAAAMGADPERVTVFHSLSKRSNVPGLRSGFVAGGPRTIKAIRQLRSYAGPPMPGPIQATSARLWSDEAHVEASRALYQEKYAVAQEILGDVAPVPPAGFFLWLPVEDGEAAALRLWRETGVRVLPGAYLSRDAEGGNPGAGYVRVALVADVDEVRRGLTAIRTTLYD